MNGSHYEYKTKVVFSCDPGYHGLGPASIECLPNGTWSWRTERPYCQSKYIVLETLLGDFMSCITSLSKHTQEKKNENVFVYP